MRKLLAESAQPERHSSAGGFDWSSAGIGAATGAGAILTLLGAFLLVRSSRVVPQAA